MAGASRYDVEVNITGEFTPGSKVFGGTANGTSLAPTLHLPNNTYHWRVRAIDPDGHAGVWNPGPVFKSEFDDVTPTVDNVRVRDHATADLGPAPVTAEPFFAWDPVPGATRYELQFTRYSAAGTGYCDWSLRFGDSRGSRSAFTPNTAWAAGTTTRPRGNPGSATWPAVVNHDNPFISGEQYCMRILAIDGATNASEWTEVGGANRPAFAFQAPSPPAASCPPPAMPQAGYPEPAHGVVTPRTPFLMWNPVPGAASYFVVVAREAEFTEVVDFAFTRVTVYAPRTQYEDETTSYYWAVIPAGAANGTCAGAISTAAAFHKRSVAPGLIVPSDGEDVPVQPLFRWSAVESADKYRLQVATDPEFGELVEDVTTAATAYAGTKPYPADSRLYWRVRANTLNWSPPRSFRRRLPVPAIAESPSGGENIPVLAWHPVEGAVSYDMHVDQADGTQRDFTMRSTRFTPVLFWAVTPVDAGG